MKPTFHFKRTNPTKRLPTAPPRPKFLRPWVKGHSRLQNSLWNFFLDCPASHLILSSSSLHSQGGEMKEALDLPASFCFCPRDEELIRDYLRNKNRGLPLPLDIIKEYDVYKFNPDQLPCDFKYGKQDEMYFFSTRDRKYQNGSCPNRSAGDGFWKATTADQAVSESNKVIGYKSRLVFYKGKPPKGKKTNWIMHEYRINKQDCPNGSAGDGKSMRMDGFVLCRIYELRRGSKKSTPNGENGMPVTSFVGEPATALPLPDDVIVKLEDSGTKDRYLPNLCSEPPKNPTSAPINGLGFLLTQPNHTTTVSPSKEINGDSNSNTGQEINEEDACNKRQPSPPAATRPEKRGRLSNGHALVGDINGLRLLRTPPNHTTPMSPSKENNDDSNLNSRQEINGEVAHNKCQPGLPSATRPEIRGRPSNGHALVGEISRMDMLSDRPSAPTQPPVASDHYSYATCLEELQQLEGLDDVDLVQAVEVLKDLKNAVAFMTLRGTLRLNWLRMKCRGR
ncbi:NAC domain containing protein 50-like [Magnolia sinica]|uniref:NAC domain containing protein 50-like n=1 Tax=Magnolia sinica TaxID=86752 RepID=UPI002659EB0A|nr:NAC domain containing protein 50-like [Magnolia sinica]